MKEICTKPNTISSSDNDAIDHATKMITTESRPCVCTDWGGILLESDQCPVTHLNTHLTFHLFERRVSGTPGTGSWVPSCLCCFGPVVFSCGVRPRPAWPVANSRTVWYDPSATMEQNPSVHCYRVSRHMPSSKTNPKGLLYTKEELLILSSTLLGFSIALRGQIVITKLYCGTERSLMVVALGSFFFFFQGRDTRNYGLWGSATDSEQSQLPRAFIGEGKTCTVHIDLSSGRQFRYVSIATTWFLKARMCYTFVAYISLSYPHQGNKRKHCWDFYLLTQSDLQNGIVLLRFKTQMPIFWKLYITM